nr:hypothetical protein [Halapricum sp. CBA1109]
MTLRSAIDDYKRRRDSAREFPGERRSVEGTFSGLDERLVYVSREGWHRDYSYPVSGLAGVERSRFGVETLDGRAWFDDIETTTQRYVGDTAMVETVHDGGRFTVTQTDLTVGALHYTHFEVDGEFPQTPSLQAFFDLTPEQQESRLGKLEHEDAVEVHHDRQHNFVTASTGVDAVYGQLPEQFDELAAFSETVTYPRSQTGGEKYEDALLNGTVVLDVPLDVEDGTASTTVVSLLVDTEDDARSDALDRVRAAAAEHGDRDSLASLAREHAVAVPESVPRRDLAVADLRVLELLSAETGAHIAGPDMDPFYVYTGGYGYTWFRDDSEIARFLLEATTTSGSDWTHSWPTARPSTSTPNSMTAPGPTACGRTTATSRPGGPTPDWRPATTSTIRPTRPAASPPSSGRTSASATPNGPTTWRRRSPSPSTASTEPSRTTASPSSVRTRGRT